jgi:hypothetical protein
MKDALTKNYAVASAPRSGRLARLVRGGVVACALACLAAGAAQAQQQGGRRDEAPQQQQQQQQRVDRYQPQAAPVEPRNEPRFDTRSYEVRDDQRRQLQVQQEQNVRNAEARRGGRMTPDERRDLRRQINEAGMDLYPNAPRR